MQRNVLMAILAGTVVGGTLGLHARADALSCACGGDSLELELVSGPAVACPDGSCTSEWNAAPRLYKNDYGLYGDLLASGSMALDPSSAGGE